VIRGARVRYRAPVAYISRSYAADDLAEYPIDGAATGARGTVGSAEPEHYFAALQQQTDMAVVGV
jgi:hypothetical protein